ncbi:MAG TPA: alpha/beta hydrolase [Bacillota bacterium]|nr:alpha/beta hydrolase [Bacillota bacterium]HPF42292.1 alpha/beta hydrolase [Bacillota bacterium]HPJ86126.1 alpha/beta hydrolase [Bacillota bacterium]HPQ61940.1 alpha/beta hydrolase [Bacillota bacterium]HRX91960.1 alpha/beta hydrolase [Candidatus Izemoplasmatales bacterium]
MDWYWWVLIFLALIAIYLVNIGYLVAKMLFHPKRMTLSETRKRELEKSPEILKATKDWRFSMYQIESRHKYPLQLYFLPAEIPTKRYIVIAHGYTYTSHGGWKYATFMRNYGFNVILYDERYHGASGGKNCTMGYYEKDDLYDIISDTYKRFGNDIYLGTYGESMGGAIVLMEQSGDDRVKFVVADCPFADLSLLLKYLIRNKVHLPMYPVIWIVDFFFRLFTKTSIFRISPIEEVRKAKVPILFMHGGEDAFIPPIHSELLFAACPTGKDLFIAGSHSRHTDACRNETDKYKKTLRNFMVNIVHADIDGR